MKIINKSDISFFNTFSAEFFCTIDEDSRNKVKSLSFDNLEIEISRMKDDKKFQSFCKKSSKRWSSQYSGIIKGHALNKKVMLAIYLSEFYKKNKLLRKSSITFTQEEIDFIRNLVNDSSKSDEDHNDKEHFLCNDIINSILSKTKI